MKSTETIGVSTLLNLATPDELKSIQAQAPARRADGFGGIGWKCAIN